MEGPYGPKALRVQGVFFTLLFLGVIRDSAGENAPSVRVFPTPDHRYGFFHRTGGKTYCPNNFLFLVSIYDICAVG
jgi:hypothetical protein